MVEKSLIIQSAVNIAEEISASAIIIISNDQPLDIDTHIPVLLASTSAMMAADYLLEAGNVDEGKDSTGRLQAISETLYYKGTLESERISDASAIAFSTDILTADHVVGIVSHGDTISIVVHDLKANPVVKELRACSERVNLNILKSVLMIAMDLGAYGREGKPVGTAFIVGDMEEVMKRSHQLVLNPFFGHPKEELNIRDSSKWETVKEFAQLDGIFVMDSHGYIHAAGRYLDVNAKEVEMVNGLGGRHASAAAITRDTEAIAVTTSESDGMVRVYRDGVQIIEIDPRASTVSRYK
jgi:diadenylate cyclase